MSRLIAAELNRWFSRGMWWVVFAAAALLVVVTVAGTVTSARPMTAAQISEAEQQFAQAQKSYEADVAECMEQGSPEAECREMMTVDRSAYFDEPFDHQTLTAGFTQGGVLLASYAALLLGASFMGAEFKTGNISTWLTYVPARIPVLVAKTVATIIGSAVFGVVVLGLFQAGAAICQLIWYDSSHLHWLPDATAMAGRGVALTVGAALVGLALATLLGSTVGPVGVLLGVLVAQWLFGMVMFALGLPGWWQAALPDANVQAFISGSMEISYQVRVPGGEEMRTFVLTGTQAGIYLAGVTVALTGLAWWRFTRREIR